MSPKSHIRMIAEAIAVFNNDGTVDMQELDRVLDIAFEDDHLDSDEKRVLGQFFDLAEDGKLAAEVRSKIRRLREKFQIRDKDKYLAMMRNTGKLMDE